MPDMGRDNCLKRAETLLKGARQESYGDPVAMFARIAAIWSAILGHHVTPKQAALMMGGVKIAREAEHPQQDNLDDACAYMRIAEQIEEHGQHVTE